MHVCTKIYSNCAKTDILLLKLWWVLDSKNRHNTKSSIYYLFSVRLNKTKQKNLPIRTLGWY